MRRILIPTAIAALIVPLGAAVASADSGSGHDGRADQRNTFTTALLLPVANNRVHGIGNATVQLHGTDARITIHVRGLLNHAPHAMHIHVKGTGECPSADDSTLHNGHLATSTTDGLRAYGPIGTSLTTSGDTSPASALAVDRFPSAGTYTYTRTIHLTPSVADQVRHDNAVIVVHGIDYNKNGTYDSILGPSELNPALPQEATAPALCGPLH
jgi:Cu/Zn superoxide dismutase